MPSTWVATFDRTNRTYKTGESVKGNFVLTTTTDKPVHAVYILLKGEGKVFPFAYSEKPMRNCLETLVNERVDFIEGTSLAPGTYTFPFDLLIPDNCPSSCFYDIGTIVYTVELVIDRPMHFDKKFTEHITVIQCYDLNVNPELLIPIDNEIVKTFCCWPCASAPIILNLRIPFGGYVPGQKINCTICIDNQAVGKDLLNVQLSLIQNTKFASTISDALTRIRIQKKIICSTLVADQVNRLSKHSGCSTRDALLQRKARCSHSIFYLIEHDLRLFSSKLCY